LLRVRHRQPHHIRHRALVHHQEGHHATDDDQCRDGGHQNPYPATIRGGPARRRHFERNHRPGGKYLLRFRNREHIEMRDDFLRRRVRRGRNPYDILLRALVGGEVALRLAIEPEPGLLRGVPSCDLGSSAYWPPCGVTYTKRQLAAPLLIQLHAGGRGSNGKRTRSCHFNSSSLRIALGPAMGLQPDQRHKNYKETQEQKKIRNSDAQHETVAPDHRSEVGAWPVAVVVLHLVAPRLPRIVEVTPLLDALSGTCP